MSPTHALPRLTNVAKMEGRRQAFQNNSQLHRFVLHRVRLTGKQLGVGSYGSVEELEVNGLMCAGKRLHEALLSGGRQCGRGQHCAQVLVGVPGNSRTAVDIWG